MRLYAAAHLPGRRPAYAMLPEGMNSSHPSYRIQLAQARVRAYKGAVAGLGEEEADTLYLEGRLREDSGRAAFADIPGRVMEWAGTTSQPVRV